jgi:hypothetical protein
MRSSRKAALEASTAYMQGRLHLAFNESDSCMCCDTPFIITDVVDTTSMYVLVPKEQVYVKFHQWEHEYLKSQVQELLYIFRRLGASNLRITVSQNQSSQEAYGGSVHANLRELGVSIGAGVQVTSDASNMNSIEMHMAFDSSARQTKEAPPSLHDKIPSTVHDLIVDPAIHYLSNRPAWQNFVNNRLQGLAKSIHFTLTHHNVIALSKRLVASLSEAGIAIHESNRDLLWVRMVFEADWDASRL